MSSDPLRSRREYGANAILEDSRLRGDLTDEEYAPIQAEALAEVDARARATAGMDDDAARHAIDAAVAEVKERVRAQVAAPTGPTGQRPATSATPRQALVARLLDRLRARL